MPVLELGGNITSLFAVPVVQSL